MLYLQESIPRRQGNFPGGEGGNDLKGGAKLSLVPSPFFSCAERVSRGEKAGIHK